MKKLNLLIIALVAFLVPTVYANAAPATTMPDVKDNKVTLAEDVELASSYTVPSGVTEVNLGGHTITLKTGVYIIINSTNDVVLTNGTITQPDGFVALNIKSTGTVTISNLNVSNKDVVENTYAAVQVGSTDGTPGKLVIADGTVITGSRGVSVFGDGSHLEIKGGEISTTSFAVSGNGNSTQCKNSTIVISGGVLTSAVQATIYQPQTGTLTITGGTLTGANVIVARQGTIEVKGGTLEANGDKDDTIFTGDVKVGGEYVELPAGVAVVVDNTSYVGFDYSEPSTVTISGGVINSNGAAVIAIASKEDTDATDEINVTGGTFNTDVESRYMSSTISQSENGVVGTVHDITVEETENGTVNAPKDAAEGETVTVECIPDEGFEIDTIVVTLDDEDKTEVEVVGDQFVMPAGNVNVTVTFKEVPQEVPSTGDNVMTYAVIGTVALISVLGTALYFKKVNE